MTMRVSGKDSDIFEGQVDVGPDRKQFYGSFQERGTKKMPAQPFLNPALEATQEQVANAIKAKIEEVLKKFQ